MAARRSHDPLSGPLPDELRWVERFTALLDSKFRIPGTNIRFGIDPIIGLVPYAGELVTLGFSGLLVLSMIRHGASGQVVVRMLGNIALDAAAGFVPILGDLFDVYFKANRRNYRLLLEHQTTGKHRGPAWPWLLGASVVLLAMFALLIWGLVAVIGAILFLFA